MSLTICVLLVLVLRSVGAFALAPSQQTGGFKNRTTREEFRRQRNMLGT
jgi:hypothetical protein